MYARGSQQGFDSKLFGKTTNQDWQISASDRQSVADQPQSSILFEWASQVQSVPSNSDDFVKASKTNSPIASQQKTNGLTLNISKQNTSEKLFNKNDSNQKSGAHTQSSQNFNQNSISDKRENVDNKQTNNQQISIENQNYPSNSSSFEQTQFNHQSKFFLLSTQVLNLQQQNLNLNNKMKKSRLHQGINSTLSQQKIPTIQEWFQSLSIEDRVLSLTLVDKVLVDSIVRMQQKLNKKGQGRFKLQTVIQRMPVKQVGSSPRQDSYYCQLKQDFKFTSLKAFIRDERDKVSIQTKQLHEKELLDFVRLTQTKGINNTESTNDNELNTLTVAQSLVQDPLKFYSLVQTIVGNNFLKLCYDVEWDEQKMFFIVKTPLWFNPADNNSLANWIIFYMENSLQIHYLAYVRSRFRITKDSLDPKIFIPKEGYLINAKNELQSFWRNLTEQSKQNPSIIKELGQEIFQRSSRAVQNLTLDSKDETFKVNQLNGGLISVISQTQQQIQSGKILEALLQNQDAELFPFHEIGLLPLSKISSHLFQLEKTLIEVLRDRQQMSIKMMKHLNNKKNQKKKNKKKMKTQQAKDTGKEQENLVINQTAQEEEELKKASNDDKQAIQEQSDEEEEEELYQKAIEFSSNVGLIGKEKYSTRNNHGINDLINELLIDKEIPIKQLIVPKLVVFAKALSPVKGFIELEASLESYFELNVVQENGLEPGLSEAQQQDQDSLKPKQKISASSESTDDLQQDMIQAKYLLLETQQSTTPQQNSNIKIEIDPSHNYSNHRNLYSSDVGESVSNNLNNIDLESSNSNNTEEQKRCQQQISISPQKKYISKCDLGINKSNPNKKQLIANKSKTKNVEQDQEIEHDVQSQDNFQIIRSNKNFNPILPQNNKSKQQKKKKRSKAVVPNTSITQQQSLNHIDQSSRLNSFMRNIIKFEDEKEETNTQLEKQKSDVLQLKEDDQNLRRHNFKQNDSSEAISNSISQSISDDKKINVSKECFKQRAGVTNKSQDSSFQTKQLKTNSRFDTFINQKDPQDKKMFVVSGSNYSTANDKKKKINKSNKSKNNKKSINNKHSKKPGLMTPQQPHQLIYDSQKIGYNAPAFGNNYPMAMNQTMDLNATQDQYMGNQLDFQHQQSEMNDIFRNMTSPNGIQYLQQLINQAFQHQNSFHYQNQFSQPMGYFDNQLIDQQVNDQRLQELTERFYLDLEYNMLEQVRIVEKRLESVRKEREAAISILESIIKETCNSNTFNSNYVGVKMYGSMASKLAIEQSDVDLAVVGLDFKGQRDLQIKEMRGLCDQIELFMKSKHSLQFIDSATVPVIKLQIDLQKVAQKIQRQEKFHFGVVSSANEIDESMRYLGVDITFEDSSKQAMCFAEGTRINLGIQCISYIQQLCMSQQHLKPIVIILKKLLQNQNLNQPYHGGLNSYSLVLMTSAFLNRFSGVQSLSKNLVELLRYFGYYFDHETIMIDQQDFIKMRETMIDPMTIIDPLNKANNTTRSTFRIKEILEVFRNSYNFFNSKLVEFQNNPLNNQMDQEDNQSISFKQEDLIQILLDDNNSDQISAFNAFKHTL